MIPRTDSSIPRSEGSEIPEEKRVRDVAASATLGALAGTPVGVLIQEMVRAGLHENLGSATLKWGATAGFSAGVLAGAVYALSSGTTPKEKARDAVSALFWTGAAFVGSLSLGTGIQLQSIEATAVVQFIEAIRGERPSPTEALMWKCLTKGFLWVLLSAPVGELAAKIGTVSNVAAAIVNGGFERLGWEPPIRRFADDLNPGMQMLTFDLATAGLAAGAAGNAYMGTLAAWAEHPAVRTAATPFGDQPNKMVSGIGGGSGTAVALISKGMMNRRRGGLKSSPMPKLTWASVRDTSISRIISMVRSGMAGGAIHGMVMWGLWDAIAQPGGFMSLAGGRDAEAAAALQAFGIFYTICVMANYWYRMIAETGAGQPGDKMHPLLVAMEEQGLVVCADRTAAELTQAERERVDADIEVATMIVRDCFVAIGSMLTVAYGFNAAFNKGGLRLDDRAITEALTMSPLQAYGGAAFGFALQTAMILGFSKEGWLGRNDPHSRFTGAAIGGMVNGLVALGAASASHSIGWGIAPTGAIGVGAAVLSDRIRRSMMSSEEDRFSPPAAHPPVDTSHLRPNGYGQRKDENWLQFQYRKWRHNIGDAIWGLPPLPAKAAEAAEAHSQERKSDEDVRPTPSSTQHVPSKSGSQKPLWAFTSSATKPGGTRIEEITIPIQGEDSPAGSKVPTGRAMPAVDPTTRSDVLMPYSAETQHAQPMQEPDESHNRELLNVLRTPVESSPFQTLENSDRADKAPSKKPDIAPILRTPRATAPRTPRNIEQDPPPDLLTLDGEQTPRGPWSRHQTGTQVLATAPLGSLPLDPDTIVEV